MDFKDKYLGITIGPIYATFNQARKTREVWLGSFFFSYVMKLILKFFNENKYGDLFAVDTSLLKEDKIKKTYHGAGIYNDRCYVDLDREFSMPDYEKLIEYILNGLNDLKALDEDQRKRIKQYIQVYCTVQTIVDKRSILRILNQHLDNMELQTKYYPDYIYALASGFDERKNTLVDELTFLPDSLEELQEWFREGFIMSKDSPDMIYYENLFNGIYSFPSILEISTTGLKRKKPDVYRDQIHSLFEDSLEEEIRNAKRRKTSSFKIVKKSITDDYILQEIKKIFKKDFQTVHKYIAIVKADGDRIGELITKVNENESVIEQGDTQKSKDFSEKEQQKRDTETAKKLEEFSGNLTQFAAQAADIIHDYGGKPIFIGGDDLFFFAPVVSYQNGKDTHLFELIQNLDSAFHQRWDEFAGKYNIKPSLSYGISITYYKYPMNESIGLSHDLLSSAKNYPGKNNIAIKLMSHSGSYDEVVLNKHEDSDFNKLISLLNQFVDKDREIIVSSVLQRLRTDESVLLSIARDNEYNQFNDYFFNEYDLENLKDEGKKAYVKISIKLFNEIFSAYLDEKKKEALEKLRTIYRLLNFLIHKEQ